MAKFEKLPMAEEDVLLAIWNLDEPATTAAITDLLREETGWGLTTVASFLKRLEDRGYVTRSRKGRSYVYEAAVDFDAYRAQRAAELLERYFQNSPNQMVQVLREQHLVQEAVPRNIPNFLL